MGGSWRACAALLAALAAPALGWAAEPTLESRALAALRPAVAASSRGDDAEAAARFDAAAEIPEIAAPARILAARAWLDANQADRASASARSGLAVSPAPPWDADLFEVLARASSAQGDVAGAQRAWREALARGVEPKRAAEIRLALADSFAPAEVEATASELLAAWIAGTPSNASDRAEEQLAALERRTGRSLRSANDWNARADRLFDTQRTAAALLAYDSVLKSTSARAHTRSSGGDALALLREHAQRRRGECLFRSRRYTDAAAAFAAIPGDPEAEVWHARSLARANRVEEALVELADISTRAPKATAAWASYLAGLLYEGRDRPDEARLAFTDAAARGDAKVASDSLWRLGFGAYRAGDLAAARRHLDELGALPGDALDRLPARYWGARARERAAERNAELVAIRSEFPFSYYGVRAAELVPSGRATVERTLDLGSPTLRPLDLLTARVLLSAGLTSSALRLTAWLEEHATTLSDRVALARVYAGAEQPHRAQAILVKRDAELLARGPAAGQQEIWRLAWPDAFASERRVARRADGAVDPWLVAALMREESGYRTDAVSVTGALGLLQLMPETAEGVARRAKVSGYTRQRLLDPAFNIRLGTLHLEELAARFPGDDAAIAAAYNAGAGAVAQWRRSAPADEAEWVETIPYDETRGYVRRVLRSRHIYQELY